MARIPFYSPLVRAFRFFLPYFWHKESRYFFLSALCVTALDITATTYLPFAFKNIVEGLEASSSLHTLMFLGSMFFTTTLVMKTATFLQDLLFYPVINTAIREMHFKTAEHIHNLPLSVYQTLSIPEVISYQKRIGFSARFFLGSLLVSIVPTLIKFIVAFSIILHMNVFSKGIIIGLFILFMSFWWAMGWYVRWRRDAWKITDKVTQALGDSILNTKLVRFYKSFELARLRYLVHLEWRVWFKSIMGIDLIQVFLGVIISILVGTTIMMGIYAVHHGHLTLGQLILLNGQLGAFFIPINQTLRDLRQIFEASIDIEKITVLFSHPIENKNTALPTLLTPPPENTPWIRFDQVNFSYEGKPPVIQNLSFDIFGHTRTLIFGVSGVGKSTLLNLMTGLLPPSSGTVHFFDQDIKNISLEDLGQVMHFIPQDNQLFNGSLYENLVFGVKKENLSEDLIEKALEVTQLSALVKHLPEGLNTLVGEMGTKLSGGERQRLIMARALLLKPKILIFDETTNAMDHAMEEKILKDISSYIPTLIFISHRKTTHHVVDHILELSKGSLRRITKLD